MWVNGKKIYKRGYSTRTCVPVHEVYMFQRRAPQEEELPGLRGGQEGGGHPLTGQELPLP